LTEKELKKLNRYQLLELLVMQTERADRLQKQVEELEGRLQEQELNFSKLGSLAEAAAQITGLFEATQRTAELYLDSAKKQSNTILAAARSKADTILEQARVEARYMSVSGYEDSDIAAGKRNADDV